MKSSQARKTSITLPEGLEEELKARAETEHRTLSGLLQEAARFYLQTKKWEALQRELSLKAKAVGIRTEEDVDRLIHQLRR
ncbi:MAG: CopG family transcriptional regulator [Deltaproteobacteria bacterium]|nr:CopG family transcriptional regulator [Deltaproteobacteria bacterium]